MYKRIFKICIAAIGFTCLFNACKEDNGIPYTFISQVDLKESTLSSAEYTTTLLFSTDNGATYVNYPILKVGQTFKVKLRDTNTGNDLQASDFLTFDWSASSPKPDNPNSDTPQFTLSGANNIVVKVLDQFCPYNASSWVGDWVGDEVGACCSSSDLNTIRQDSSDPNKFIMNNFWGDGVDAYFILSPSTNVFDQVITMPEQTTDDPGVASGTGTYDQCRGTFTIHTTYDAFGGTYIWDYNFHR